jgi:hypothetical protein
MLGLGRNVQYTGVDLCVTEMWVPLYRTTRLHNPEARNLNLHGLKTLYLLWPTVLRLKGPAFSMHLPPP